jgi:hypothetical protein
MQLPLRNPQKPDEVRAAALEEMQIAGMIDETGKVGVLVIDTLRQPVAAVLHLSR